jgi:methionyl-tRNA synthetase
VLSAENHPDADKLFVLQVDIGKKITLVAGLKEYYQINDLIGKQIVVVSNLKPAKLRGIKSQGMLLAADKGDEVVLLTPVGDVIPGERVSSGMSASKKRLDLKEFQKLTLRVADVSEEQGTVGGLVNLKSPPDLDLPEKVAVFLPSEDAKCALPLFTEKMVAITTDRDIGGGAKIR